MLWPMSLNIELPKSVSGVIGWITREDASPNVRTFAKQTTDLTDRQLPSLLIFQYSSSTGDLDVHGYIGHA